jgi:hypothetical protein
MYRTSGEEHGHRRTRWPWGQRLLARIATLRALVESEKQQLVADKRKRGRSAPVRGQQPAQGAREELLDEAVANLARAEELVTSAKWFSRSGNMDGALANTNEAHTLLLRAVSLPTFQGMLPDLVTLIQKYLPSTDYLRGEVERFMARQEAIRIKEGESLATTRRRRRNAQRAEPVLVEPQRQAVVDAVAKAYRVQAYEVVEVRSFERLVYRWAAGLAAAACLVAAITFVFPNMNPLCFYPVNELGGPAAPTQAATAQVVCPTREGPLGLAPRGLAWPLQVPPPYPWAPWDYVVIQLVGAIAAAVTGAATLHRLNKSGTAYNIPSALAVLKVPAGALTAVLGLLLMRADFVPGLSALDSPAQIIGWAIVFGAGQQLFTRIVDQQGTALIETAPSADQPQNKSSSARPLRSAQNDRSRGDGEAEVPPGG